MSPAVVCAGHPRDMGIAQGRALRAILRAEVARAGLPTRRPRWPSLRPVVSGPLCGRGPGRELFRHFAHQAERLEGLAQASDLPLDSLVELQLRVVAGGRADEAAGWIVRESRPVVGFRSLELTLAWLVSAVAGVNEAGLAVLAPPTDGAASAAHRDGAAPPLLLVQDCLARFENLAGALDWCRKRPVEGEQTIHFGDASGARATIEIRGRERRVELADGMRSSGASEAGAISGSLGGMTATVAEGFVRIDPAARRLFVDVPGAFATEVGREFGFPPLAPSPT